MLRFFNILPEIIGWLLIALSPILGGILLSLLLYSISSTPWMLYICILVNLMGFIIGPIWATKIWKKTGTIKHLSRILSIPEVDSSDNSQKRKNKDP